MPLSAGFPSCKLRRGENSKNSKGSVPQSEIGGPAWAWQLEQVILLDPSTKVSIYQSHTLIGEGSD